MNRLLVALFALASITVSAATPTTAPPLSQSRCNLTEANAPNVRGIRLGMSTEQVLALFPGSSKRNEIRLALEQAKSPANDETASLAFSPATYPNKEQFTSIDSIAVTLHRGRVVDFTVVYLGPTWRTADEWIAKLSEAFGLPSARDWEPGPDEGPNKTLRCNGIDITAAIQGGSASIRIRNLAYLREAQERANSEQERKRRELKP